MDPSLSALRNGEKNLNQYAMAPEYASQFACIGPACEESCCTGWTVPVDQASYERFEQLPPSALKTDLLSNIDLQSAPSPHFAILRQKEERRCSQLTAGDLCQLHAAYGEAMLPATCRQYPRYLQTINGTTETSLALSCPEAARLVLLHPDLLGQSATHRNFTLELTPDPQAESPLLEWARPTRALVLWLIAERQYPLWQRMFLLRILCHRLDALSLSGREKRIPDLLVDFHARARSGSLRPAMDRLPVNTETQLDAVLQLAGLLLSQSALSPRFLECVHAFTTGIGNGPGATLASLSNGYDRARAYWLNPFLARYPHLLENWLSNAVLRHRFPFGTQTREAKQADSLLERFEGLAANFALMRGLLTGVAGYHRENFSAAHAVHTIQSASRHFEHHPEFVAKSRALLHEAGLTDLQGISRLLHDEAIRIPTAEPQPLHPTLAQAN